MSNSVFIIHVTTALLSIFGFIFRGILRFSGSDLVNSKWLKITPHIVDTVLIISAILLFTRSGLDLMTASWLQAKIVALIVYIALGLVAFRFAKTTTTRLLAWLTAILIFGYILTVAVSKNPLGFFLTLTE